MAQCQIDSQAMAHKSRMDEIKALDAACEQKWAEKQKALDIKFVTQSGAYRVVCQDYGSQDSCRLDTVPHQPSAHR